MSATEIFQAAMRYVVTFSPLIFVLAVISVSDLILDFVISLFRRSPDFGMRRRTRL